MIKITVRLTQSLTLRLFSFSTIADENHPPKAHAGGDKIITLPVSLITLDGSGSSDDRGIVSYSWTRDDKSLAAGVGRMDRVRRQRLMA